MSEELDISNLSDRDVMEKIEEQSNKGEEVSTDVVIENQSTEESKSEELEYTEVQKKAISKGWDPTGAKAKAQGIRFREAEEFLERGEDIERLTRARHEAEQARKESEALRKEVQQFLAEHKKDKELAAKDTINEINKQRDEAIKDGDLTRAKALEARMLEEYNKIPASTPTQQEQVAPKQVEVTEEAKDFVSRNATWFNQDPNNMEMVVFADQQYQLMKATNPSLDDKGLFKEVEQRVKRMYPQKFENEAKKQPTKVGSKEVVGTEKEKSYNKASKTDLRLAEDLVRQGFAANEEEALKVILGSK